MKALKQLGVTLLVVGAIFGALFAFASWRMARLEAAFGEGVAAYRAGMAARKRPPLRGAARAANAADEYQPAIAAIEADKPPTAPPASTTAERAAQGPGSLDALAQAAPAPVPAWLAAYVVKHRPEVAAVRAATQAERCDWPTRFEDGAKAWIPNLIAARSLAGLVIVDGHERALAGDARGAAERYLDAARFAADLGEPTMIQAMISDALALRALGALERLVQARALGAADLAEVERELAVLEPLLPDPAGALRGERLGMLGELVKISRGSGANELKAPLDPVGGRLMMGLFGPGYDRVLREAIAASALDDPGARDARLSEIESAAATSWNFIVKVATLNFSHTARSLLVLRARWAALRAAAAVERARTEKGAYPAGLAEAISPAPRDPFANGELRYERAADGAGAKVWSIGPDRKDGGGLPLDPRDDSGDVVVGLGSAAAPPAGGGEAKK